MHSTEFIWEPLAPIESDSWTNNTEGFCEPDQPSPSKDPNQRLVHVSDIAISYVTLDHKTSHK